MHRLGWPLIFFFTSIPIFLWVIMQPIGTRGGDIMVLSQSIGQLLGITGMVLFSLSIVLSTRFHLFDDLFGGMNRVYIVHHQIEGIALLLLLAHPLFLAVLYGSGSITETAKFLFPGYDFAINLGISSLLTLMALLVLTYYVDLKYEFWRFTHKFLGVALFLGGIHALFITSDVSRNPVLRWYMIGITSVALIGFVYRTILGRWLVKRTPYLLTKDRRVSQGINELTLTPEGSSHITFHPGQFVFLTFQGKNVPHETHPFSISSAPTDGSFTVTVKALGDFSTWIEHATSNTRIFVEGPFGKFSTDFHTNNACIWVAGGIGITPFLSMARALKAGEKTIDLYYCVKNPGEAVYSEELNALTKAINGFRFIPWYSETEGRLNAEKIDAMSHLAGKNIYVCGPPPMMMSLKKQLHACGVPKNFIHSEEFEMLS